MAAFIVSVVDLGAHVAPTVACSRCGAPGTVGACRAEVGDAVTVCAFCFRCWPVGRREARAAWQAAMDDAVAAHHRASLTALARETARRRALGDTQPFVAAEGLTGGFTVQGSWRGWVAGRLDRLGVLPARPGRTGAG